MNIQTIEDRWSKCNICSGMEGGPILHEGQPADICFIAEALGRDEVKLNRPLIGAAGQLFNRILTAAKIDRSELFLMNTVSCRPPGNKLRDFEVKNCTPIREALIEACKPKVMVALGSVAMRALFPNLKKGITTLRGNVYKYKGIPTIVTLHPSYIMRLENQYKNDASGGRTVRILKQNVLNDYLLAKRISEGGSYE